jgi:hypothetical protein
MLSSTLQNTRHSAPLFLRLPKYPTPLLQACRGAPARLFISRIRTCEKRSAHADDLAACSGPSMSSAPPQDRSWRQGKRLAAITRLVAHGNYAARFEAHITMFIGHVFQRMSVVPKVRSFISKLVLLRQVRYRDQFALAFSG